MLLYTQVVAHEAQIFLKKEKLKSSYKQAWTELGGEEKQIKQLIILRQTK